MKRLQFRYKRLLLTLAIGSLLFAPMAEGQSVIPTNSWTDFFSVRTYIDGVRAPVGSIIQAYDPDGTLSGEFTVSTAGIYGFLHVYGDDPATQTDEGAVDGDTISFKIDGRTADAVGTVVWTAGNPGGVLQADLYVGGFPPIIENFPTSIAFHEDSSALISLSNIVIDEDNPLKDLTWAAETVEGMPINVEFDIVNQIATISTINDSGGTATIKFKVTDPLGFSDSVEVSIIVTGLNDAPVITSSATATGIEDVLFSYTATATDPDGPTLTFAFSSLSSWLSVSGAVVSGTPTEGVTSGSFRVVVSDGSLFDTLDVTITVAAVNDAPVITSSATATGIEDVLFSYTVTATDPDGPSLTFTFEGLSGWLSASGATVSGTPTEGITSGAFRVIVSDGSLSDTLDVTISVAAVNDPPVITSSATASATEDVAFLYTATATDPEGTTLAYTFEGLSNWLSSSGATVSGTPTEGITSGAFRVIVSDGLLKDTLDVTIIINPTNDPPVLSNLPDVVFNEDESAVVHFSNWFEFVVDPDNADSTLLWSFQLGAGDSVSFIIQGDSVIFNAPLDWFGTDTLRVVVRDLGLSDTTALRVTVTPVNDPPIVAGIPSITFDEDTTFSFDLDSFVSDVDNDTSELSWTAELLQSGSSILSGKSTSITYVPRVRAARGKMIADRSNEGKSSAERQLKVTGYSLRKDKHSKMVRGIADAGVNRNGSNKNNGSVRKTVIYLLSEGGIAVDSIMISIDNVTHVATITPTANFFAFDIPVQFTATDPENLSTSDTTKITVSPVNDPPLLSNLPDVVFSEDESAVVHFSDWFGFVDDLDDPDSTLIWSFVSSDTDSVSFTVQGDSVIFEAPQDWFAFDRDTIQVNISDGFLTDSIRLAVHVLPINDAPMFVDFPDSIILEFGQNDTLILSDFVLDIDDPDSLLVYAQFDCVGLDSIICVTTNADTAFIDPVGNFSGAAEFEFWVTDTSGASDTVSIIIYMKAAVGIVSDRIIPKEYSLSNNYPNPFNPQTTISYGLPQQSDLSMIIYNIMGQEIMRWDEQNSQPGFYQKVWNGRNKSGVQVGSGVYFYRIIASDFVQTKKMVLLK